MPSTKSASKSIQPISIPLIGPGGEPVSFIATINSHGIATLPPAKGNGDTATELQITLRLADGTIRTVRLAHDSPKSISVEVLGDGVFDSPAVLAAVRQVLRLDQDLGPFYALARKDPLLTWVTDGYGRMMRCQTAFEDVIKTILTTNCSWSATIRMIERLVGELGEPDPHLEEESPFGRAFPTPAAMASRDEAFYRNVIRAGYRAPHLVKLATSVANGDLDLEALAGTAAAGVPDDEFEKQLRTLPGVGPYAAAHIMQMLGRYSRLILDSWTRPNYARIIGVESISDAEITERFAPYGDLAGLAFWMTVTRSWFADQAAGEAL